MTDTAPIPVTEKIAAFVAETRADDIPPEMYQHARVAFMDWLAVTLGGKDDPLVDKLIFYTDKLGGAAQATIIGRRGMKKSIADAALINGAASHALDYDDTLVSFLGHPSVTLFPALLALSEWREWPAGTPPPPWVTLPRPRAAPGFWVWDGNRRAMPWASAPPSRPV